MEKGLAGSEEVVYFQSVPLSLFICPWWQESYHVIVRYANGRMTGACVSNEKCLQNLGLVVEAFASLQTSVKAGAVMSTHDRSGSQVIKSGSRLQTLDRLKDQLLCSSVASLCLGLSPVLCHDSTGWLAALRIQSLVDAYLDPSASQ